MRIIYKFLKKECEFNGISYSIEKNISAQQLIDKTIDSDLLIIDSETDFMEQVLPKIHCPAFITSTNEVPQKVILMSNNSVSSKIAIETYISLFSEYLPLPTYFVSINPQEKDEKEVRIYFKEKLQPHFPDLIFQSLNGKVKNELKSFLDQLSVSVLNSNGCIKQKFFIRIFHPSLARTALREKDVSLFIANHKSQGTV